MVYFSDLDNDEEMKRINVAIDDLRQTNAAAEADMVKLRSDVASLEDKVQLQEKEILLAEEQNNGLSGYLRSVRSKVISCLQGIDFPQYNGVLNEDSFDSYIGQLQTYCGDRNGPNNVLFNTVKEAIAEIQIVWKILFLRIYYDTSILW